MLVMFYFVAIFMTIVTGLSPEKAGIQLVYFAPGMVSKIIDWAQYLLKRNRVSGRGHPYLHPNDQVSAAGEHFFSDILLRLNSTPQPKYPIILGSLVIPVALGLISMGMEMNNQNLVNGQVSVTRISKHIFMQVFRFMVMTGIGIGLTAGSLAVHARFSQPEERVAVVSALTLFVCI
jgi:hypothetical protein